MSFLAEQKQRKKQEIVDKFEKINSWFSDGDTVVGVFENKDLGHGDLGHRIALPFPKNQESLMEIGKSRCPDLQNIIGWRYLLTDICHSTSDVMQVL